ncbi:benzoate 4-monooxygenase cytochrome P450 [Penicillium odoratum]|uniref:benzoate 4-monooxygenase cytochrome P450 n=1 Tax=Penicillium odoratum TaxID=1167516 RepID=UPI002547B3E0|nr:benzoate 4-monooxygenase cytochrome P450 [Penicillium odoratum]KAJ5746800.1 benzoate 4-monooxygenase cytochrome P450 [Penicillium odoratum]
MRQRRLLSHAFSEKALREQEGIIQSYVKVLADQLSSKSTSGPLNLVDWFNFTTYDLIRDLSFGERFNCLDEGQYDGFVSSIRDISKELIFIQMFKYYGLQALRGIFTPQSIKGSRAQNMKRVMGVVNRRVEKATDRKDFLHYILATMESEKGMSREEMNVNAFSFSIAGSESSATVLSGFFYYTLTNPDILKRLLAEIRGVMGRWLPETQNQHPYNQDNRNCVQPFFFWSKELPGKELSLGRDTSYCDEASASI